MHSIFINSDKVILSASKITVWNAIGKKRNANAKWEGMD